MDKGYSSEILLKAFLMNAQISSIRIVCNYLRKKLFGDASFSGFYF
jgi:hypothetical protein